MFIIEFAGKNYNLGNNRQNFIAACVIKYMAAVPGGGDISKSINEMFLGFVSKNTDVVKKSAKSLLLKIHPDKVAANQFALNAYDNMLGAEKSMLGDTNKQQLIDEVSGLTVAILNGTDTIDHAFATFMIDYADYMSKGVNSTPQAQNEAAEKAQREAAAREAAEAAQRQAAARQAAEEAQLAVEVRAQREAVAPAKPKGVAGKQGRSGADNMFRPTKHKH